MMKDSNATQIILIAPYLLSVRSPISTSFLTCLSTDVRARPPHPRVGIAPTGPVVQGSLAVGVYVGAVDGDDVSLHRPSLHQPAEQVVEYLPVRVLSEPVSEVGEEAVAGGLLPEAACPGGSSVVFEAEGEPSVAGNL